MSLLDNPPAVVVLFQDHAPVLTVQSWNVRRDGGRWRIEFETLQRADVERATLINRDRPRVALVVSHRGNPPIAPSMALVRRVVLIKVERRPICGRWVKLSFEERARRCEEARRMGDPRTVPIEEFREQFQDVFQVALELEEEASDIHWDGVVL